MLQAHHDHYHNHDKLSALVREMDLGLSAGTFIVSESSGIGRQIALRSGRAHDNVFYGNDGYCSNVPISELVTHWSMI